LYGIKRMSLTSTGNVYVISNVSPTGPDLILLGERKRWVEIIEKVSTWKQTVRSKVEEDVPA
jgi:hypothetical protein